MPRDDALAVPQSSDGRSLKLYELTGLYAELNEAMNTMEEVATEDGDEGVLALIEMLIVVTKDITAKGDKVAMVVRQVEAEAEWLEHQAEAYDAEAKRIRARAGVRINNAKRVREWLRDALAMLGDDTQKIAGPVLTVTLAKKSESNRVEVVDEEIIPMNFQKVTLGMTAAQARSLDLEKFITGTRIDQKGLNDQFKEAGILPPGTTIAETVRNLKIY